MNGCGCLRYRVGKNGIELGGMLPMCAMDDDCMEKVALKGKI